MFGIAYNFAIGRLKERSTWAAIISTAAVKLGLHLSGAETAALDDLGLALVATIVAFVPERKADTSHPPMI